MLLDVNHSKLLNFRPDRVQGRLRFNAYLGVKRRAVRWQEQGWRSLSPECQTLKVHLRALLEDWGACLEIGLYEEAIRHFFGGETRCVHRVPVVLDEVDLGSQAVQVHAEGLCFLATAFTSGIETQHAHIGRLLALTGLRAAQWINFNHTTIHLTTVLPG